MEQVKNFQNVFLRSVMVGLNYSLYKHIQIPQVQDGVVTMKAFPWLFLDHNEQFMRDYYENPPDYCEELDPKLDGNYEKVPGASMRFTTSGVVTEEMGSRYQRAIYWKNVKTEHGTDTRLMSSRTLFIPVNVNFEIKIKCSSQVERMKVWQECMKKLYKTIRFYIRFEGFPKLPALASFPESMDLSKEFQWGWPAPDDNTRPILQFDIEVRTYLPDIDETTERKYEEKMNKGIIPSS